MPLTPLLPPEAVAINEHEKILDIVSNIRFSFDDYAFFAQA
ncbi:MULTISPECIES: hypothetical protein [unclassified Nostoc]|nr:MULTISPECIES: hypothetical protein [unclassified Nostoc]